VKALFVCSGNKEGEPGIVIKNQAELLSNLGVEIAFFPVIGMGFWGYIRNIWVLYKYLRIHNYDIIHSHYSLSAFVTTIALWFQKNNPHIVSLMGSDINARGISRGLISYCSSKFWNVTIVKSRSMQDKLTLSRVEVIPNGVDISKIEGISRDYLDNRKDRKEKRILFAADPGRTSKNFRLANQAVSLTKHKLDVVYDLSHSEILIKILSSDIVLLTSKWEGSPNIVKEAMACNKPVVSTDVGDVKWLFGSEPGYFLANFEPLDVAEKIEFALEFANTEEETNGRQRVIDIGLDSKTVASKIISIYEREIKLSN